MADKLAGGIKAGATSVSLPFVLRKTADNTEMTGKVAADMTLSYWRQGGLRVAITASDLAAVDSAYSSGGVKEVDATNAPGLYRLDVPNAALATGTDWVVIAVKVAAAYLFFERYGLETVGDAEVYARVGAPAGASVSADVAAVKTDTAAVKTKTDQLVFTIANKVDASIQAAADFAQAAADKVWSSATRTLTALSTALALSVWDVLETSIVTASSIGLKLKTNLDAVVSAIKAKTDSLTFTLAGKVDANLLAINGATGGIAALDRATKAIVEGTVGAGATTTSIPTSSLSPAASVADQFKGRIVIFDEGTATVALRGQATDITANTSAGTLTVTALTTAPASGDTFTIT